MAETSSETKPWFRLYPSWVPHVLPTPTTSMADVLEEAARKNPGAPAIQYFDRVVTYGELDDLANRFATVLAGWNIGKGDRVALFMQNVPQYLVALYGMWKRGAIVVPLNPMFKEKEATYHLEDSGAKVLVVLESIWEAVAKKVVPGSTVEHVMTTSELDFLVDKAAPHPVFAASKKAKGEHDLMDVLAATTPDPKARLAVATTDTASLGYTSGTTGQPKGAMSPHSGIVYNASFYRVWMKMTEKDGVLGVAPLFHITGMVGHIALAATAACPVLLAFRFDADATYQLVERWKPTMTVASITVFLALMNHPTGKPEQLKSITKAFSGGAPIAPSIADDFEKKFGIYIHNIYGLTESNSPTHAVPLGGRAPVDPASGALSVGIPIPGCDVRLVDMEDSTKDVAPGEAGEIADRGPMIFTGYWNKPEATEKAFDKGYFLTGDIATRTEEGYFFVVDRKKDMINVSGYKVWPREVEDTLYTHPAVKEAAVIGIPDEYRGETVKAFVSLKAGATATPEEIIEHCKKLMAAYKYPRFVEIVDEIPKTVTGKFLRRVLRDRDKEKDAARS